VDAFVDQPASSAMNHFILYTIVGRIITGETSKYNKTELTTVRQNVITFDKSRDENTNGGVYNCILSMSPSSPSPIISPLSPLK
jgi:hypothetical protein